MHLAVGENIPGRPINAIGDGPGMRGHPLGCSFRSKFIGVVNSLSFRYRISRAVRVRASGNLLDIRLRLIVGTRFSGGGGEITFPVSGEVVAPGVRGLVEGVSKCTGDAFTYTGGSGAYLLSPRSWTFGRSNFASYPFVKLMDRGNTLHFVQTP